MEKKDIRVLALDLDGTLTNDQKVVTPATRAALDAAAAKGVTIVLASGRPTAGIMPLAKELGLDKKGGCILSYNGGAIIDCATGETLYRKQLDAKYVPQLCAFAKEQGVELHFVNTAKPGFGTEYLRELTGGTGYDDVICFAPVRPVVEQADAILGFDGCLNFFAGPTDSNFKAEFNFYNVHYLYTHVVGTSGGNTSDMKEAIEMMTSGRLNPATMLTHIGGLNAVVDTTLNLPNIKGGKKLIYTQIELPLTAIADFEKLGESDPLFAKLAEITARHNGLWSPEAEKYLLQAKA